MDLRELIADGMDLGFLHALIARLPDDSMTRALQQGGEDDWGLYLGNTREYYVLAGVYDAINVNTSATGYFRKPPEFDRWPTPAVVKETKQKKRTSFFDLFANVPVTPRSSLEGATSEE